jgi:hypothetical protein
MSKDLFKEAIADAKAVKEAAISNAKLALEEAFTPHLKNILAAKLEQLDEAEEMDGSMKNEKMKEMKDDDGEKDNLEELDLEEILKELESLEEMGDEGDDKKKQDDLKEMYYEDSEEEGNEEEGEEVEAEEEFDLENMDLNDLKKVIEDVVDEMMASGELEGEEEEAEIEEPIDELDINELLAEIEEMEKKETMEEPVNEMIGEAGIIMGAIATALGIPVTALTASKLQDLAKAGKLGDIGTKVIDFLEKRGSEVNKGKMGVKETSDTTEMKDEMEETINELRKELNEVNLLNAKLLYTNKIFKAKNLTESEKIKVLSTFDKATTVKETKLVYETLLENFNNKSKSPIKESLGSASKAMGIAQKQPIIETNEVFARMQKLAGIK